MLLFLIHMGKLEKLLIKILGASSDSNIAFEEIITLLLRLGFIQRIKGSHHIFVREGVVEILNLQAKNGKAKTYQVKQVREVIAKYHLDIKENEL